MAEFGEALSERELDVLRCLAQGATNKDIASDLTISENTVKVHLRNIYTKLGVSSRTEAATAAMQQGYIALPRPAELVSAADQDAGEVGLEANHLAGLSATIPAEQDSPTAPQILAKDAGPSRSGTRWRVAAAILGVLLLTTVMWLLSQQLAGQQSGLASEVPFSETPIDNTRWLESRPMPEGRSNMAVATFGLDLYQIAGETAEGVDGTVRVFNSRDRAWRTAAEKPTAVADASAAELFGEIYVVGGRLANGQPTATVEAYSPTQNAWRPVTSLPHPISGALALSDGAFLYLFGGHDGESYVNDSFVYDPASDSWRPLPPLPTARASAAGGNLTGKLVIVGGQNDGGELATCEQFDAVEEVWSGCPDMLLPRAGAGSAVLLNKLYIIGGMGEANEITFSEMFDPNSETWQVINTPMLAGRSNWGHPGVGQIETRIYALGGRNNESYLENTYVFAPLVYQTYIPAASSADGGE